MEAVRGAPMRIRSPREINGVDTGEFSRSYCDRTAIATTATEQEAYHGGDSESLAIWKCVADDLRFSACSGHRTLTCSEEYTQQGSASGPDHTDFLHAFRFRSRRAQPSRQPLRHRSPSHAERSRRGGPRAGHLCKGV